MVKYSLKNYKSQKFFFFFPEIRINKSIFSVETEFFFCSLSCIMKRVNQPWKDERQWFACWWQLNLAPQGSLPELLLNLSRQLKVIEVVLTSFTSWKLCWPLAIRALNFGNATQVKTWLTSDCNDCVMGYRLVISHNVFVVDTDDSIHHFFQVALVWEKKKKEF